MYWVTDIKCLTNVVDDGLNKCKNPPAQASSGYLHLFNPSSTTFVKHFMSITSNAENTDYASQRFASGYGNTTSAVDAVIFRMASGNIDAGDICLYGIL